MNQKDLEPAQHEAGLECTEVYALRLYVAGPTGKGRVALTNLKKICREHLEGKCRIEVVDIREKPYLARENQITAIPTLVRESFPGRKIVGDLSNTKRVLMGLDLYTIK